MAQKVKHKQHCKKFNKDLKKERPTLKKKKKLYTSLYFLKVFVYPQGCLYAGQEATVRTGHGTTDWFQIGKGVCQGWILSPCLFNLNAGYILRNAGLEEAQAGIKIAGRNINNLRYADDTRK